MSVNTGEPHVDLFPLPDSDLVFGIGTDRRHAVTHDMAVRAVGDGLVRDAVAGAVCGQMVRLAAKWGAYEQNSLYLQQGRVCVLCSWIVAGARDELPTRIAAMKPDDKNAGVIAAALGDPLAGVRLLEAIAADEDLGDPLPGRFHRSQRADLLARAAQHIPQVVVCEDCSEGSGSCADAGDPCDAALCMTCTLTAGPWAGEWEGYTLDECLVQAPCSVLHALCSHYQIPLG